MCWKQLFFFGLVVGACILMKPSAKVSKEGFVTYVVYGPGGGWGWPGMGRGWGGPYGYRPYWEWRRRLWSGPCPGPWCPYY